MLAAWFGFLKEDFGHSSTRADASPNAAVAEPGIITRPLPTRHPSCSLNRPRPSRVELRRIPTMSRYAWARALPVPRNAMPTSPRDEGRDPSGVAPARRRPLFPFWVVLRPGEPVPVGLARPDSRYAAAFVSSESALAYVVRQRDSKSELHLVCRATFGELAKRLRRVGLLGLCFEPDAHGRGETMTFVQIDDFLRPPSCRPRNPARHKEAQVGTPQGSSPRTRGRATSAAHVKKRGHRRQ